MGKKYAKFQLLNWSDDKAKTVILLSSYKIELHNAQNTSFWSLQTSDLHYGRVDLDDYTGQTILEIHSFNTENY